MHGSEAVERVTEHQTVSKHFTKAICVMKLDPHEHVVQHFRSTTEFLKDLKFNSSFLRIPSHFGISKLLERRTLNYNINKENCN